MLLNNQPLRSSMILLMISCETILILCQSDVSGVELVSPLLPLAECFDFCVLRLKFK